MRYVIIILISIATLPLCSQETKHISDSAIIKEFLEKFDKKYGITGDTLYIKFKLYDTREDILYKGLTDTCLIKFEPGDTTKYYAYYRNSLNHKKPNEVKEKHFEGKNYFIINKDETVDENRYDYELKLEYTRYEGTFVTESSFGVLTVFLAGVAIYDKVPLRDMKGK